MERRQQRQLETELLRAPAPELVVQAEQRVHGFWAQQEPNHLARWATIAAGGRVLVEAARVQQEKRVHRLGAADLARRYAHGDGGLGDGSNDAVRDPAPWCRLDTAYRRLESLYLGLDQDPEADDGTLERLIAQAHQSYAETVDTLAEHFTRALAAARFDLAGLPRQRDVFARYVRPALERGKTAYVLVDALRFEMASELAQGLDARFGWDLDAAVATVPTITEVGMAALMPGLDGAVALVDAGKGKLALAAPDGRVLRTRADRLKWLREQVRGEVYSANLEAFSPPNKTTRDKVAAADLVVLWSQEIDEFSESDNVPMARWAMEMARNSLQRAFRTLAVLGVESIVVTADHGYLFGEEPGSGMTVDPPGGQEVDRHRRVWVGRGGAADPATLRASAGDFGLGGDLEIVTPWNTAVFRAAGARAYFHGGLSPQELLVPVLQIRPRETRPARAGARLRWTLRPGTARITTPFFTLTIAANTMDVVELVAPRVRVEVRADGRPVAHRLVAASYGADDVEASAEVQLRRRDDAPDQIEPCSVTVQLGSPLPTAAVVAHLLDAETGAELARSKPLPVQPSLY